MPDQPTKPAGKVCPVCGASNPASVTICLRCGTRLWRQAPRRSMKKAFLYVGGMLFALAIALVILKSTGIRSASASLAKYASIEEGTRVCTSSDGAFGGTFSEFAPLETVKTSVQGEYTVESVTLGNGVESITCERNAPVATLSSLSEEEIDAGLQSVVELIVQNAAAQSPRLALQSKNKVTKKTAQGAVLPGYEYHISDANAAGKSTFDLFGRVYFDFLSPEEGFAMINLVYQKKSAVRVYPDAVAFFDSCFIQ